MSRSNVKKLEELLKRSWHHDVQVLREETKLLTAPGEHYGSIMLALDVKLGRRSSADTDDLHLVAKLIPSNEMLRNTFDVQITFKKEIFAYTQAIPALVAFQRKRKIREEKVLDKFFPRCLAARPSIDMNGGPVDEDGVLLFENLQVKGYTTLDRLVGFDFEASKLVLKALARFHAVPIAARHLQPEVFSEKVLPGLGPTKGFDEWPEAARKAFETPIEEGVKAEELEPYAERIRAAIDRSKRVPWARRPPPAEPWGTMSHSDLWTSNVMVLKDEAGAVVDVKIVDLQMVKYWSCCCDLVFFLFTSVVNEVLDEHFDDLVKTYYDHFIDALSDYEIDLDRFAWNKFKDELDKAGKEELYHILFLLKPVCVERGKVTRNAEEFQDSDWTRQDLLGPVHRKKLIHTLLSMMRIGWI
ncbi:uncharacterized protein LOC132702081 [Cylas formicarius]|uniref:uncharacterized protein LOC132702081 n=1 Tax=Cylas formicarius TaxID=197179 RepID=UPI002958BF2D|nr:uncharacterized protein LOC132702081 [Cylas formicarius]